MQRPLALLATIVLALAGLVTTSTPASARQASLTVSPGNGQFTAGQRLTFSGSIGVRGRRRVVLQSHMGRPGDVWRDVAGARGRTTRSGRFTLSTPAPSMLGIIYRVAAGSRHTPTWTSQVRHQDVLLRTEGPALSGSPLTVVADTRTMPLLPGRGFSVQQRVGTGWTTVASGTIGADGTGRATVVPATVGTAVYRVRLEDWRSAGDRVGWFPSYPLYVDVLGSRSAARAAEPVAAPPLLQDPAPLARRTVKPPQTTAGRTYRWGTQRFDFDWEVGESLTDRPTLGTRRRGWWLDASDGTGRVALRNGAMQLSSNVDGAGRTASTGSMWATLQGNAQAYGRWETRVMPMVYRGGDTHYRVVGELVPVDPAQERCGAQNITVFDISAGAAGVGLAANALDGSRWSRTVPGVAIANTFHAYAVEVHKKGITWFVDGKPVGRVTDRAAVSGQALTMRVTMRAEGVSAMRTTRTLVDWVRGFPIEKQRTTRKGARLARGTHGVTC